MLRLLGLLAFLGLLAPVALVATACGSSHGPGSDVDGSVGRDSGARDAGPPDSGTADAALPRDAGHSECEGLGAAACFAATDCAPLFDDRCCPTCSAGPCADCTDPGYVRCIPFDECRAPPCGTVPSWGCFPSAPDCTGAVPTSVDGCTVYGCVPGFPPGDGEPVLEDAVCVPVTGDSCTASCRRLPPTCPAGTVPEGDGACYTDRCIAASICD